MLKQHNQQRRQARRRKKLEMPTKGRRKEYDTRQTGRKKSKMIGTDDEDEGSFSAASPNDYDGPHCKENQLSS